MKTVLMTNGEEMTVDDEDYERVVAFGWSRARKRRDVSPLTRINGKKISVHRFILNYPDYLIDHIDGNPLNNCRSNLRRATISQNNANSRIYKNNKSGYKGVTLDKRTGKWKATIRKDKRQHYLGLHASPICAAIAYNRAAKELFGEYARLNEVHKGEPIAPLIESEK